MSDCCRCCGDVGTAAEGNHWQPGDVNDRREQR